MRNRLLIADPDETLADIYRRFFEKRGFNVETASSGLACLNKLREHRPKLLVLDMELLWGGFDGVLARISCDPDLPFVPVVLLDGGVNGTGSRHSSDLVIERLRKPFRLGSLFDAICSALQGKGVVCSEDENPDYRRK